MARLKGLLLYRGSFKSVRHYSNLHNPTTFAGEKGGANRELILNNPSFARTRENMNEFGGVGLAVKEIRRGLQNLLPEQADLQFTGRLIRVVKDINRRDDEGKKGKRAIVFSAHRPLLAKIIFDLKRNSLEMLQCKFRCSHDVSRVEATLSIAGLTINSVYLPAGATHYRVRNHLCLVSDFNYSDLNRRYEPVSLLSGLGVSVYSDFIPLNSDYSCDLVASFPEDTFLTDDCSVMQCIGVELFVKSSGSVFLRIKGGCLKVGEVF